MTDWEGILRQYAPLVWATLWRLLGHEADAADCFQETFLSAWQLARRQRVENWAGLLQRLATARALDQLRRRHLETKRRESAADLESLATSRPGPVQDAEASELGERLREALRNLPPQQAEAYCLRHLSGMSYDEIAAELGTSADNAGVLLHRARARLRELLSCRDSDECRQR